MKKKWLFSSLYFLLFLTAYANDLLSNGEISFYYQKDEKAVAYLRGDALWPIDISRLRFYWITEEEEPIDLQNNMIKAEKKGQNILELYYQNQGIDGKIAFLPSFRSKNQLSLFLDFQVKKRGYFVIEIVPQEENNYLQKEERGLQYQNFFVSSNRNDFDILLSEDSSLKDFKMQRLLARLKKTRGDHLYYLLQDFGEGQQRAVMRINFFQKGEEKWKTYEEMWQEEAGESLVFENPYKLKYSSKILQKNLEYLDLLSSRVFIPDTISYAKSKQSYLQKQQLLLMRALYGFAGEEQRILEDVNIRKKEMESVIYFYYAFLYADKTGKHFDSRLMEERLIPQILSIYDGMTADGRLVSAEDSLESYVMYDKLISLIANREEFASERDFIMQKKKNLESYIQTNFITGNVLKDRSSSDTKNPKNIEYVFLLPQNKQKQELQAWYQRYYNKTRGVILYPGEQNLDMLHNLNMVVVLYEYGMFSEANSLLEHLEKYIGSSQNYVLESYPLNGKEGELEISSEAIYCYLLANLYREQKNGNER